VSASKAISIDQLAEYKVRQSIERQRLFIHIILTSIVSYTSSVYNWSTSLSFQTISRVSGNGFQITDKIEIMRAAQHPTSGHCKGCGNQRKKYRQIQDTHNLKSNPTSKIYDLSFKTVNIAYILQCSQGGMQYIGESEQSFCIGYRSDYDRKSDTSLVVI